MGKTTAALGLSLALGLGACSYAPSLSPAAQAAPQHDSPVAADSRHQQTATFSGGCFWAMQTEFEKLKGVKKVTAGYAGGTTANPSYEQVSTGTTGHAETVQILFDPSVISYPQLVHIFLTDIDPTTRDRQGNDTGTQYRSAIFYHGLSQKMAATKIIAEINKARIYPNPIVTEVAPYTKFYDAEAYHQNYFASHPTQGYCAAVVGPEVRRFVKMNKDKLK
jgi:peptide-methionine (S)-S-oxide reductase